MKLSSTEWKSIETLLPQALALPVGKRTVFLDRNADTPRIRLELESLIAASEGGEAFLSSPVGLRQDETEAAVLLPPDTRLGPWEVGERIGRGGMGEVYAARRADGQFAMDAALKILKPGLDTRELLQRFERERNILARLSHPNIARLLDAGETSDHRPYFVMERVVGQSITSYCDDRRLGVRDILKLAIDACDAVDSAHRALVLHRDLKPSNVMVTAEGVVKLLDFGVAKIMAEEGEGTRTLGAGSMLTPAYAAPEQILDGAVSTPTDVYALGAVLYQLLTGELPHRRQGMSLMGVLANVRNETVQAPSRVLAATSHGRERARELAGDLDLIVLKALHADSARRYRSAHEFGSDLRRYLEHMPVQARPDSVGYRLKRMAQRHPAAVASAVIALLALVGGFGVAVWQAGVAQGEARRAEDALATANAVSEFLNEDLLARADPAQGPSRDLTVRTMLDRAAETVDARFADKPRAAAQVHATLGRAYFGIGEVQLALPQFELAAALYEQLDGPVSLDALDVRLRLLNLLVSQSGVNASCEPAAKLAHRYQNTLPADDPRMIRLQLREFDCLANHGAREAIERARSGLAELIARMEERGGPDSPVYGNALRSYLTSFFDDERYVEAEVVASKLVALQERLNEAGSPAVNQARALWAGALAYSGQLEQAETQMARAYADAANWEGSASAGTDYLKIWEVILRTEQGRFADAERLAQECLNDPRAGQRKGTYQASALFLLSEAVLAQQRPGEAAKHIGELLPILVTLGIEKRQYEIPARAFLADALLKLGRVTEARQAMDTITSFDLESLAPTGFRRAIWLRSQGLLALRAGKRDEGVTALRQSGHMYERLYGAGHWRSRRASQELQTAEQYGHPGG